MPKTRQAVEYLCDRIDHPWCPHARGVTNCPHAVAHGHNKTCKRPDSVCICWGITSPFDGTDECVHVNCKRIK